MSVTQRFRITTCSAIPDPGVQAFEIHTPREIVEGIVLHWHGQWYAYRNACPHTGVNLNWSPDQFLDVTQCYIQCSLHGALFEPETGHCTYGPCQGDYLTRLAVQIEANDIYLVMNGTLVGDASSADK